MQSEEGSVGKWFEERCAKRNMVVCQKAPQISIKLLANIVFELRHSLQQTVSSLVETKKKLIENLNKESIPISFIYVQLPKDKAPSELWPSMTWQDISKDYEGVFFRVVGGDAASFGQVQQGNAPRLGTIHNSYNNNNAIKNQIGSPANITIPINGWSDASFTGRNTGENSHYMNFKLTDIAEVRPKNMAVKMYRRTA